MIDRYPIVHAWIAGVWIATATRKELVEGATHDASLEGASTRLVFDANGHGIALAESDPDFARSLQEADVVHADGGFLVALSKRMAGEPIKERSPTTDMIHDFAREESSRHLKHFLLGATEDVNARATEILRDMYPDFKIVGRRNGYFTRQEEEAIIDEINDSGADVVWVGLGKPLEQAFCLRHKDRWKAAWVITAGGCFNYITGDYPRAPGWMQRNNLEWLHRMLTRPRQLGWRYLTTNPVALKVALTKTDKKVIVRR